MPRDSRSDATTPTGVLDRTLARLFEDTHEAASWFTLPGGVRLFAAGDPADTLYLLRAGRLGVFKHEEGSEPHFVGVVRPGEPAGEMAMIAGTPHSATVVALRDSEILALPREAFFTAAAANPELMTELARLMILRARQATGAVAEPTVFGFIGLSERPILSFIALLEAEIAGMGFSVKVVTSRALKSAVEWFSAVEESHDYVLYAAERDEPAWAHLCARQVDRLFLVGRSGEDPVAARPWQGDAFDSHRQVDLILIHRPATDRPTGTSAWLDAVSPARWFHVRGGDRPDTARIARTLTGTSVGLVLSGGGARAYAHIGAIQALREAQVPFDFVGGASMGAIICAGVAMGWDQAELDARIRKAFVTTSPVDDIAVPIISMIKGKKVDARLLEHYGDIPIEDLWLPFYCVSSNITSGGYVVHKRGLLRRALRASIAIPGVLPPVVEGGAVLVDGAVMRNFPVDLMRNWHGGPVVGVDVSRARGVDPKVLDTPKPWWRWVLSGAWRQGPPIISIMIRSATLTTRADLMEARGATDLLILPNPGNVEIRDWKNFDSAVLNGWNAAKEALAKVDGPVTFLKRRKQQIELAAVEALRLAAPAGTAARKAKASIRRRAAETLAKVAPGRRPKKPSAPAR
jgi:NTE family protein